MCHYCGAEASVPRGCPTCGNVDLQILGRGTQRVEETLAERFPTARIVRIDRDSARRRDELVRSLIAARDGAAHILVGTQLLAKGHDFPGLSLVGVLGADQGLLAADYRASERLYATLTQVAGRAGRREQPGEVLIQTRYPAHPHFASLARHDYPGFAAKLLQERREAGFPPFVAEAVLRAEAEKLDFAMAFLREARALTRRAGVERARLVVQSALRPALQDFLPRWIELFPPLAGRRVRWHVDVDPLTEE
jgi:primosomal protein N' (replication factor Y)